MSATKLSRIRFGGAECQMERVAWPAPGWSASRPTPLRSPRRRPRRCDPTPSRRSSPPRRRTAHWAEPGPGHTPKTTGTMWTLMFLEQFGADGHDERIHRACAYVLEHSQSPNGGLGWDSERARRRALRARQPAGGAPELRTVRGRAGAGRDPVAGESRHRRRLRPSAPVGDAGAGFSCACNGTLPCAWGANRLSRIPARLRTPLVVAAVADGAASSSLMTRPRPTVRRVGVAT